MYKYYVAQCGVILFQWFSCVSVCEAAGLCCSCEDLKCCCRMMQGEGYSGLPTT
jgi:hypothetical protein